MHYDFRLKVFKTVAEELSFTRAAKELFLSQPSVTNHIKELEREVGSALFVRMGNSITLTQAGEVLYDYALKIDLLYKEFAERINVINKTNSGNLRLGASTTISQYILPRILSLFKKRFPEINLTLFNGNSTQIEQLLINKKIDLGLIEGNSNLPQIKYETFLHDEIILVTSVENRKINEQEITLSELIKIPLVIRESGSGTLDVIDSALKKVNISRSNLNIEIQLGSTEAIKEYLKFSDAAAFLSINAIQSELLSNKLRIIDIVDFEITRVFQFVSLVGSQSEINNYFKKFTLNYLS